MRKEINGYTYIYDHDENSVINLQWVVDKISRMPPCRINNIYLEGTDYSYQDLEPIFGMTGIGIEQEKYYPEMIRIHVGKIKYIRNGHISVGKSQPFDMAMLLHFQPGGRQ